MYQFVGEVMIDILLHYIFIISHLRSTVVLLDGGIPRGCESESHHRHPHCRYVAINLGELCPCKFELST